jgi:uncharacterized protein
VVIGLLSVVLAIPEATSLKDKRRVVRRVLDRARAKFSVAAAEVGSLDAHRRASLGFAVVSNDARHASSMIETIAAFVASEAMVVSRKTKIERRSDLVMRGVDDDLGTSALELGSADFGDDDEEDEDR